MPSGTTQAQYDISTISSGFLPPDLQMDATEFWVRNGYSIRNGKFNMREVYEGDIADQQNTESDAVYHKGHKAYDFDGKGTSYSVVLMGDDPEDLPSQALEWLAKQGLMVEPCSCE